MGTIFTGSGSCNFLVRWPHPRSLQGMDPAVFLVASGILEGDLAHGLATPIYCSGRLLCRF